MHLLLLAGLGRLFRFVKIIKQKLKQKTNNKKGEKEMYKTEVIGYTPKAKKMAEKIEEKCNEMEKEGFSLISATITPGAKAILVFKK